MAEQIEGIIIPVTEPPVEESAHARIPSQACYPMGQFVRFMEGYADVTVDDILEQRNAVPSNEALVMRDIAHETLAACGRTCVTGCRLGDVLTANASPLQIELAMADSDRTQLGIVGTFLDTTLTPEIDEDYNDGEHLGREEQFIKDIVGKSILEPLEKLETEAPTIEDDYYRALAQLCNSNLHVIKMITGQLIKVGSLQLHGGTEAAREQYGISLDDPTKITAADLRRLLLHPDQSFHFILNLKSTPRSEIFG